MTLLAVKGLKKVYENEGSRTEALRGINLSIEKGEFIAIMGASGSGKSTLLQILGLLDTHTDGSYFFSGKDISSYTPDEVARMRNQKMGFVFQAFNLLPRSTVLENVKLPLIYSDVPEEEWQGRAEQAVMSVGLAHRMHHEASQLSGGEKQRVAIARALVCHPEVIFADEPTGNLDSKSGAAIIDIIQKLNTMHGHTVILITHETYTAEYAARIVRLSDGVIESDERVAKRRTAADGFLK